MFSCFHKHPSFSRFSSLPLAPPHMLSPPLGPHPLPKQHNCNQLGCHSIWHLLLHSVVRKLEDSDSSCSSALNKGRRRRSGSVIRFRPARQPTMPLQKRKKQCYLNFSCFLPLLKWEQMFSSFPPLSMPPRQQQHDLDLLRLLLPTAAASGAEAEAAVQLEFFPPAAHDAAIKAAAAGVPAAAA